MDKIVIQRVLLCIDFVYLMSYPVLLNVVPGDATCVSGDSIYRIRRCDISYPEMQCRIRRCNVVSGDAMSYPEMQCRTRRCNVVSRDAMSYPEMQCRIRRCNVVPGDAMSYPEMQCRRQFVEDNYPSLNI